METKEMLRDINNKTSAKRVWASRYLWVGLVMAAIWFLVYVGSVFVEKDFTLSFPYELWFGVVGFGSAILGVTIFETKNK